MAQFATVLGLLAVALFVLSYQIKSRKRLIAVNAASRILSVAQYLFLGAIEGALLDVVAFLVSLLCHKRDCKWIKRYTVWVILASNAVIVGVGLPGLSNERNIMREYYDQTRGDGDSESSAGGEGYAYAYTYPGMNHVLQAAGRVIRRPEDYGVVVLIDDRYTARPYPSLFPAHWECLASCEDTLSLKEYLEDFWAGAPDETEAHE